jgi:hypothetical protein
MIPLTEAKISYDVVGRTITEEIQTVIINRDALTSFVGAQDLMKQKERAAQNSESVPVPRWLPPDEGEAAADMETLASSVLEPSLRAIRTLSDVGPRTPTYLPRPGRS